MRAGVLAGLGRLDRPLRGCRRRRLRAGGRPLALSVGRLLARLPPSAARRSSCRGQRWTRRRPITVANRPRQQAAPQRSTVARRCTRGRPAAPACVMATYGVTVGRRARCSTRTPRPAAAAGRYSRPTGRAAARSVRPRPRSPRPQAASLVCGARSDSDSGLRDHRCHGVSRRPARGLGCASAFQPRPPPLEVQGLLKRRLRFKFLLELREPGVRVLPGCVLLCWTRNVTPP